MGQHYQQKKMYSINFTATKTIFCLSLHYNGASSYLSVNGTEIIKFKAKDFKIVAIPLCLGNISEDVSNKTFLNGFIRSVYDFNVDYVDSAVNDIVNIQKYLMKKNRIIWCLDL